jgi:hypothetical protein
MNENDLPSGPGAQPSVTEPVSTAGLQVEESLEIENIELTSRMRTLNLSPGWGALDSASEPVELITDDSMDYDFGNEVATADADASTPPESREEDLEVESLSLVAQLATLRNAAAARERALQEQLARQQELLDEQDAELFRQAAQISSLTLERDGLHARLQDSGEPVEAPAALVPSRTEEYVRRLKARLDERGRALKVAREDLDRLRLEGTRLVAALQERTQQVERLLDQLKGREARRRFDGDFRRAFVRLLRGRRGAASDAESSRPREDEHFMGAAAEATMVLNPPPPPQPEAPVRPVPVESVAKDHAAGAVPRRFLLPLDQDRARPYEVTDGRVYVGRGAEASLRLVDATVSRLHAVLRVEDDRVIVEDAASTNGVYVNGRRVRSAELQDFDTVAFGEVGYLFRLGPAAEGVSPREQ